MLRFATAALALGLVALPAFADEFTDTIDSAMAAYKDNRIKDAGEDLAYATKLLNAMKSQGLAKFLPEAMPGWTRKDNTDEGAGIGMAMFGGGTTASAIYTEDSSSNDITLTLVADSPLVSSVGAMLTGMASLSGGKPIRIQRTEFGVDDDGKISGVVNGKVMVSAEGSATKDQKTAYLEKMDLKGLSDY